MGQTSSFASLCLVATGIVLLAVTARAEAPVLAVGDLVPELSLEDQHGETRSIDDSTRLVLFSRDMEGGDLLKSALADVKEDFLPSRSVVYVSDISGMPRLVARMFAIPSMRRRPYPMLLDRTGEATASLPDVPGRATVLFLEGRRIERIEHAEDVAGIRALLRLEEVGATR